MVGRGLETTVQPMEGKLKCCLPLLGWAREKTRSGSARPVLFPAGRDVDGHADHEQKRAALP